MVRNVGDKIYWYTAKNCKFIVHEGEIIERHNQLLIYFKDDYSRVLMPKDDDFGKIISGTSLWLTERNDELARKMFIEYQEQCLSKLQKQIDDKIKFIELLKGSK